MSDLPIDLKRVSKISQKYKDIVFGFIKEAQSLFPNNNAYFHIVDLIKHLCLLFYYRSFESSILTDTEQYEFFELLSKNHKLIGNNFFNLIYRSKRDGLNRNTFIDKVHDKSNILCFIHTQRNNLFGGYTSIGWKKEIPKSQYSWDDKAFIFTIRSSHNFQPCLLNIKPNGVDRALGYDSFYSSYCNFGDTWVISIWDDEVWSQFPDNYDEFLHKNQLLGGEDESDTDTVSCIEVFQLN